MPCFWEAFEHNRIREPGFVVRSLRTLPHEAWRKKSFTLHILLCPSPHPIFFLYNFCFCVTLIYKITAFYLFPDYQRTLANKWVKHWEYKDYMVQVSIHTRQNWASKPSFTIHWKAGFPVWTIKVRANTLCHWSWGSQIGCFGFIGSKSILNCLRSQGDYSGLFNWVVLAWLSPGNHTLSTGTISAPITACLSELASFSGLLSPRGRNVASRSSRIISCLISNPRERRVFILQKFQKYSQD